MVLNRNNKVDNNRWVKWLLPFYLLVFLPLSAMAQTLKANAPQQVAIGQQFRLTYTVNSQDVSNFHIGQIPSDAFEILMGPSTSTQSSFSMVNGRTTQSSSVTYTYILSALKNGTFTIPAATINVDGSQISSNARVADHSSRKSCVLLVVLSAVPTFSFRSAPLRREFMSRNLYC